MNGNEVLLVSGRGPVRRLTLNRPTAKNALSQQLLRALDVEFDAAVADPAVAVVVIEGNPGCFSAGADVREMTSFDAARAYQFLSDGGALFRRIEQSPKPVIARVDGIAAGGGFELALSCSLMFASTDSRLGLPETSLGLMPGFGGTQRLTRLVGPHRAARLMLTGALVSADEAWGLGLLSAPPVPATELGPLVDGVCDAVVAKSATACSRVLAAVDAARAGSFDSGLALEASLAAGAIASKDGREGMSAFAEKRLPQFRTEGDTE